MAVVPFICIKCKLPVDELEIEEHVKDSVVVQPIRCITCHMLLDRPQCIRLHELKHLEPQPLPPRSNHPLYFQEETVSRSVCRFCNIELDSQFMEHHTAGKEDTRYECKCGTFLYRTKCIILHLEDHASKVGEAMPGPSNSHKLFHCGHCQIPIDEHRLKAHTDGVENTAYRCTCKEFIKRTKCIYAHLKMHEITGVGEYPGH